MPVATTKRFAFLAMLALGTGCLSLPRQPPLDLSGPDWTIRNGQAVWKPAGEATELAGELLVATRPNGSAVVQFIKPPLPFVSAQQTEAGWQAQFFAQKKSYSGRGRPPSRIIWLQLPSALAGKAAADEWALTYGPDADTRWRFQNARSGECLEGFLTATKLPSTYRVRAGETLTGVARWQGISVDALQKANPGSAAEWFKPGKLIQLPQDGASRRP